MDHHWLLVLLPIWIVALVSPGPDALVVAQTAASSGRRDGFACAAGVGAGMAVWSAAALGGLAAIFAEAAWLYRLVVLAGAAYLVVTGLRMLADARRGGDGRGTEEPAMRAVRRGAFAAFRRGLVTNLSNPKAAVLFASVFAVTLPPHTGHGLGAALVLGVTSSSVLWYVLLARLLSADSVRAAYRRAEHAVTAVAGACFAGFGAALALREAR
jgi:RhtB (resistance to homoserine/threonine) family protein